MPRGGEDLTSHLRSRRRLAGIYLTMLGGRPLTAMPTGEEQDLRGALDQARGDFDDRVATAFLGPMHAGKTVHCALLKDAAAKHLMQHTNGRYVGVATDGSERINRITDALYGGRFPEKTVQGGAVPLTVEITSPRNGTNLSLIFHDMAGEEYDDLLVKAMPTGERIRRIVGTKTIDGRPYGLMTHLIFAKIYVVVVDCSAADSWGSLESYVKDAIRGIYDIKKHTRDLYRGKIPADMAVVFAKHDALPDGEDVDDLAERLPEVRAAIEKYVGGDVAWFKSRLECVELGREEIEKMNTDRHAADLERAEAVVLDRQGSFDKAARSLGDVKSSLDAAASSFDEAKKSGDAALVKSRQSAHRKALHRYEEAERARSALEDELGRARSDAEKIRAADPLAHRGGGNGDAAYRPAKPLSYNTDEYLDMLAWLIKMANRSTGR